MSDNSFMRYTGRILADSAVQFVFGLAVLAGLLVAARFVFFNGVLPLGLIALAFAVVLSLLGYLWFDTVTYVGTTLAWLAMAVVLIDRLLALGLNGWGATAFWILSSLWAGATYSAVEAGIDPDDRRRRARVFYGLFIAWPATALLVIERGNAWGLSGWVFIGGWVLVSFVALLAYSGTAADESGSEAHKNDTS